jgi:hypothetical protein
MAVGFRAFRPPEPIIDCDIGGSAPGKLEFSQRFSLEKGRIAPASTNVDCST